MSFALQSGYAPAAQSLNLTYLPYEAICEPEPEPPRKPRPPITTPPPADPIVDDSLATTYTPIREKAPRARARMRRADLDALADRIKADVLASITTQRIEILQPCGNIATLGRQHYLFPLILKLAEQRIHAYLCGPAGSGKTSAAHSVAKALGLPFYSISVCAQTTKADLCGFTDATGTYRPTLFRRAYETGGIFLLDEIDNGNANVLAVLNSALANDAMAFPDGMVARHADFVLLAGANTFGGATSQYIGRNQLDAATLDRFAYVEFPYDPGLEASIVGVKQDSPLCSVAEGGPITPADWLAFVQSARKSAERHALKVVISPRATIFGARLARAGVGKAWLTRMLITRNMDNATISKLGV